MHARQRRLQPAGGPDWRLADLPSDSAPRILGERDRVLRELIEQVGPYGLRPDPDGWAVLMSAILHQQIPGRVAQRTFRAFCGRAGGSFPPPRLLADMENRTFSDLGVPPRKRDAMKTLAHAVLHGELDLAALGKQPDHEAAKTLCQWKGVGPWTANMWLIFHLGRPDIILPGDLGVRKALQMHFGLAGQAAPERVMEFTSPWSPYRTVASWYLWRSLPGFPPPGLT